MSQGGPPYRDYTDEPVGEPPCPAGPPAPGTGSIFVAAMDDGSWEAVWQGDDDDAGSHVSVDGAEHVVLAWARSRPARVLWIFSGEEGRYIPLH